MRFDSGPPGFYLLERPFVLLSEKLTDGAPFVRAVSFFAALGLFAAARTLARGAARATLIALLSSSTLLNLYAAEARPYALLAALVLTLFLLALRGDERPARLAAIAGLAAAALYTHYLALFALAALLLVCAVARRWRSLAALAAGSLAFAPWLPVLRAQPAEAIAWMRETPGGSVAGFLSALGGVGRVPASFGPAPPPALFFAALATGVNPGSRCCACAREPIPRRATRWPSFCSSSGACWRRACGGRSHSPGGPRWPCCRSSCGPRRGPRRRAGPRGGRRAPPPRSESSPRQAICGHPTATLPPRPSARAWRA